MDKDKVLAGLIPALLILIGMGVGWFFTSNYYKAQMLGKEETERQLRGDLSAKEVELERAKADARQLQSALVSRDALLAAFKDDQNLNNARMRQLIKDYNLKIDSMSTVVAQINGHITGGTSSTTVNPDGSVAYSWDDKYQRFHLRDPNINLKGNEDFKYNQTFKVDMAVFRQPAEDGSLRIQNVALYELLPDGTVVEPPATIDYTKSSFKFAPGEYVLESPPGQRINLGLTSAMEPLISWEPLNYKSFAFGLGAYGDDKEQSLGLTGTWYPKIKWVESQVGFGGALGYSTESRATARVYVAVTVGKIRKKGA